MPEISLTDAQYDQLEAVRADVEAAFVDGYGHARLEDAVDYLLDTYTPPDERDAAAVADGYDLIATAEYPELQRVAASVEDIPGSGIDADEMRGKLLVELGPEELADRLSAASADDEAAGADESDSADSDHETVADDDGDAATGDDRADGDDSDGTPGGSDGPTDSASPVADAGGVLSAANKLLTDNDDVWRKTDAGEQPYEVDLPDGTTEGVRTKDDVRQLLFKHYR